MKAVVRRPGKPDSEAGPRPGPLPEGLAPDGRSCLCPVSGRSSRELPSRVQLPAWTPIPESQAPTPTSEDSWSPETSYLLLNLEPSQPHTHPP